MVAISDLKTHCLRLVGEVARRRTEIVITKRGKPIAKVVPVGEAPATEVLSRLRGTLTGGERVTDFDTGVVWSAGRK